MIESLKYSHLAIRFALAIVFIWFGIDKFIHPDYWINAWYPHQLDWVIKAFHIREGDFMTAVGIVEILVGVSLTSGLYMKIFSLIGLVMLVSISVMFGLSEVLVRDVGLMGGFIALIFWPSRRSAGY